MNNIDVNSLMNMLSKMDKKELEEGLKRANDILKSKGVNTNNNSNNCNCNGCNSNSQYGNK